MNEKMLDLLIYSLDNNLTEAEQAKLDAALAASASLRAEKEQLLQMRTALGNFSLEKDSAFTADLMQHLDQQQRIKLGARIRRIYPRVVAACIIIALLSMLGIYLAEGSFSMEAIVGIQDLTPEDAYSYLDY